MNKDKTRNLRQALGSFPTGVTVVSCLDKNKNPLGFTANSFTSVSLDPQLISICIDKESFNIDSFSWRAAPLHAHPARQRRPLLRNFAG